MATAHVYLDTETPTQSAREFLALLDQFGNAFSGLKQHFAAMSQQKDGDGSQASHFDPVVTVYEFIAGGGIAANAHAKATYDELNSLIGTHGAAIEQICAKLKQ